MVETVVALLAVSVVPVTLYGVLLVVVGREAMAPSERLPLRRWTRWDLWHHLRLGARELTRIRLVATGRTGSVTSRGCRDRP